MLSVLSQMQSSELLELNTTGGIDASSSRMPVGFPHTTGALTLALWIWSAECHISTSQEAACWNHGIGPGLTAAGFLPCVRPGLASPSNSCCCSNFHDIALGQQPLVQIYHYQPAKCLPSTSLTVYSQNTTAGHSPLCTAPLKLCTVSHKSPSCTHPPLSAS